jgi:LacI family transcriptional regulator
VTLSRIAQRLGLSVATVSRALAGYGDVATATRRLVEAEAARIQYRPNRLARNLRDGRTGAVGVVLPTSPGHFDDPFFLRMLAAMGARLAVAGLDLLVSAAPPGEDELRVYRQMVEHRRVDGMLICRTRCHDDRISYLIDQGVKFVAHGRTHERRAYAHVDIDGEAAFRSATQRLIDFGHRRIGMINAPEIYMFSHHRRAGWRTALRDARLPEGMMEQGEATEENGFRLATAMLDRPGAPTAILCATDRLAVGALHAIGGKGLRAGRDVSVIGYDNLSLATYTDPPLTTIEQPIERAASRMVEMLLALIGGADAAEFSEIWPATLISRSSDGPAPPSPATKRSTKRNKKPGETHVPQSSPNG